MDSRFGQGKQEDQEKQSEQISAALNQFLILSIAIISEELINPVDRFNRFGDKKPLHSKTLFAIFIGTK